MKTQFRESFAKDLKTIKDKGLLKRVNAEIEAIENASSFGDLPNLKKLKGTKNYFRQRIGDYRLGLVLQEDAWFWSGSSTAKTSTNIFPKSSVMLLRPS